MGLIERREDDYVDLSNITSVRENKKELKNYIERQTHIKTCDYCDIGTGLEHSVTPGEQRTTNNIHILQQ